MTPSSSERKTLVVLRAIVFDLDDTLYPERAYVASGFQAVGHWVESRFGIPADEASAQFRELFDDGVRTDTFDQWLSRSGFAELDLAKRMVQIYRSHRPNISPFFGTEDLLAQLHSSYRLALLSDGNVEVQRRKLQQLRLGRFFDAVLFSDEYGVQNRKPSTFPFQLVLERLDVKGKQSIYVADNPIKDFLGARLSGMGTIRVRAPEGLYSHLEPVSLDYAPDSAVQSLDSLPAMILRLWGAGQARKFTN
jgi:putative hydrolase of the HAD superfamily